MQSRRFPAVLPIVPPSILPAASVVPALACVLSWGAVCQAQAVRTEAVDPVAANPAVSGWFAPHLVAFAPDVTQRNQLFVFLHGMGSNGSGASALVTSDMGALNRSTR